MINLKKILTFFILLTLFSCQPKKTKKSFDEANVNDLQIPSKNNYPYQFVEGTHDVPLAPGLELVNNEDINFDSIAGSFSSSAYKSTQLLNFIQNFYLDNLPKLGWKIKENQENLLIFIRDNQQLKIESNNKDNDNIVIFNLTIN